MTMVEPAFDEATAERRLSRDRSDIAALIAKADHRLRASDRRAATAFYQAALQAVRAGARIEAAELTRVQRAAHDLERSTARHMLSSLRDAGFPESEWHPRFAKAIAIMLGERPRDPPASAWPQMPRMFFYPGLAEREFFDSAAFSWREAIEAATDEIRAEGLALLEEGGGFAPYVRATSERPQGDVHGMLENRDWTTYDLTEKGQPVAERIELCPQTHRTIAGHAPLCDIANRSPSIMFSLLKAGSKIPPHTGMINTRLVCHLPLVVPGEGALRVGSRKQPWHEGRLLVFDDTVEHEAWNGADSDRLVLIFDVWHPDLHEIERDQIRALFEAVDSY